MTEKHLSDNDLEHLLGCEICAAEINVRQARRVLAMSEAQLQAAKAPRMAPYVIKAKDEVKNK